VSRAQYVIVGAGPAGLNAVESIRAQDRQADIKLVSVEPAYARMALPYYLSGRIERAHLLTADPAYYDRHGVEPLVGQRAVSLDTGSRQLRLSDGQVLAYDKLLLAPGSSPTVPPIPGRELPGVHTFWTLDDADRVIQAAVSQPEALMVGAGFVGLIVLSAMLKAGWRLHVTEMLPQVLPRMLDRAAASLVSDWLRARGVQVHTETQVIAIQETPSGRKRVLMESGSQIEVDVVIVATGVRPNVDLAQAAGLQVESGILVNEYLQTSDRNVYAAGDAAQGPDRLGGPRAVHAIQPTATDHGRLAGANMAGQSVAYPGSLSMNILDVMGLHCVSIGRWDARGLESSTAADHSRALYRRLVWEEDRLVGAVLVGPSPDLALVNDIGMAKGMIQAQVHLGAWRRYIESNPWDLRRPFTAARVTELLLNEPAILGPSRPRIYRFRDLQVESEFRPTHSQLLRARPEALVPPIPAPPLR